MKETVELMADVLNDPDLEIDLTNDNAVINALVEARFQSSVINVFKQDAVNLARELRAGDGEEEEDDEWSDLAPLGFLLAL